MKETNECAWTNIIHGNHAAKKTHGQNVVEIHFPVIAGSSSEEVVVYRFFEVVTHLNEWVVEQVGKLGCEGISNKTIFERASAAEPGWKNSGVLKDDVSPYRHSSVVAKLIQCKRSFLHAGILQFLVILVFTHQMDDRFGSIGNLLLTSEETKSRANGHPVDSWESGHVFQRVRL